MNKRGLSPVIATILLISLVLILAIIIFLWARAFLPEALTKDIGGGAQPIENACKEIVFRAEYYEGSVVVQNDGNVPLHGIEVGIKKGFGTEFIEGSFTGPAIRSGEAKDFSLGENAPVGGEDLIIIPVLLGMSEGEEMKAFPCDEQSVELQTTA